MRRMEMCLMISMVLVFGGSASDFGGCPVLTVEVREKIRIVADDHPSLLEIFLPEWREAPKVGVSSVPEHARTNAVLWIPRVVRARWLPTDIESTLVALKDVKLRERRNKNGSFITEVVGDFLTLDHEVDGYGVHVQESGVSVSLRVDFAQPVPVGDDPGAFISRCLTDFLNIPEGVVPQLQGEVKQESPLYVAYLRSPRVIERELALRELALRTPPGQTFEIDDEIHKLARQWQWWDRVWVCTDGRFFFVNVVEAEPVEEGRYNPRAKLGLPDRF